MTIQEELLKNYENLDLKKLPETFKKQGFTFELVKRTNAKCLYKQIHSSGVIIAYELFPTKITKHRESMREFFLKHNREFIETEYAEYKELYPCDEDFGKRAESYPPIKLEELLKQF